MISHLYQLLLGSFGQRELHFAIGMILAIVIGYLIGAERELRGKDAGVSTHILVIVGSLLFTIASTTDVSSPSRIAAQIVTGIGFLGAGLIFHADGGVKNLTTASSLWVAAAIGILLGFGLFAIAFVSGVLTTLIPRIPRVRRTLDH